MMKMKIFPTNSSIKSFDDLNNDDEYIMMWPLSSMFVFHKEPLQFFLVIYHT
jgi:hypothetical protein